MARAETHPGRSIALFDLSGRKVYEMNRPAIAKGLQLITLSDLKIALAEYIVKVLAGDVRRTEHVLFK